MGIIGFGNPQKPQLSITSEPDNFRDCALTPGPEKHALTLVFSLFELLPRLRGLRFGSRHLILGGILSGFFGGLSGHQGALRSAFLAKAGVTTSAFVGTNAVIGFLVDMARIAMYAAMFVMAETAFPIGPDQWPLISTGTIAAFAGIMIGKRYLHKNYHERSPDTCGYFTAWDRYASCDGLNLVKSASRN